MHCWTPKYIFGTQNVFGGTKNAFLETKNAFVKPMFSEISKIEIKMKPNQKMSDSQNDRLQP